MSSSDELVAPAVFASTLNLAAAFGSRNLIPVHKAPPPPPPPKGITQPPRFAVSGQPYQLMTHSVAQDSSKSPKPHGKDSQPRELSPSPPITFVSVGAHPEGEYPGGDTFHTLFAQIRAFQGELNSSKNMVMLLMTYLENYEQELKSVLSYHLPNSEKKVQFLIAKIEGFRNTVAYYKTLVSNLSHLIRLATAELDTQLFYRSD